MANNVGDILSQLVKEATASGSSSGNPSTDYDYLKSIDDSLKSILKSGGMSQSNAKFQNGETDSSNIFRNRNSGLGNNRTFTGGFEKAMMDAFLGSDFKNKMKGVFDKLAKDAGVSVQDLPNALGKQLGQQLIGKFKGTKLGSDLFGKLDKFKGNLGDKVKSAYTSGRDNYLKTQSGQSVANSSDSSNPITGTLSEALKNKAMSNSSGLLTKLGTSVGGKTGGMIAKAGGLISGGAGSASAGAAAGAAGAGATAGAGGVLAGAGAAAGALGPLAIAAVAAMVAMEGLAPAIEGTKKLFASMNKAANRYQESRQKNLEYQIERMTADIEAMVKAPFDILEEAAQKIYDTWDSNLQLISGTQGYNKSDLQDLMGIFAQRLRDEGLTNILTGVDVTESLAKVLQSGLSGKAAEEFSYLATILNAAVPTQDFFGFGDTYASLAANMIKAGKTQDEAITYANEQMRSFASNVLFASRQLAGGFTTGLKDVQSLFDQSVQIAIASRTGDPSRIAGVLTSVAAITGAIAPDLASSMIDVIYKAAVGGNSTELVALRSLAGINASNTEFLRQLANDPQAIFSGLFTNLANMQNMSADAYMEVAEGLSSVFGISMDAFARIDFNYLSQAISSMNTNSNTLEENMKLLMSGQTTTTAEQLRAQQINQYMIEEGLAYVLDNEVARSIQENMWAEQRQRELLESTYAVELTGSALEFLEGLKSSVENILGFLNPIAWLGKAINLVATANETDQQRERVRQLLELGKVGTNQRALYQLMTPNVDLHLIEDIVTLMGGTPATSNGMLALGSALSSPFGTYYKQIPTHY